MTYNLARALQFQPYFAAHNLFFFPAEADVWLSCVERLGRLASRVKVALDAANADSEALDGLIRSRSGEMQQLVVDDLSLVARLKAGDTTGIPVSLYVATEQRVWEVRAKKAAEAGQPPPPPPVLPPMLRNVPGGGSLKPPQSVEGATAFFESFFAKRKEIEEDVAKNAIKDSSVMLLPFKGVLRRTQKVAHDLRVMDVLISDRLYVASSKVKDNINELVFKGQWTQSAQAIFHRIVTAFVASLPWSARAQQRKTEWAAIWNDARSVNNQQGRAFLQIVEHAIAVTGIAS